MRRLGVAMALCGAVFVGLHELGRRWGATRDEVRGPMAGDDIVPRAKGQTTHAITIDAAVERVWPWLVQMGYHRAGWDTYPWVDRYLWRIDNPSAAQLIPELQDLSVGDIVPDGGLGRASRAGAALNVARPSAAARKDDRRLDVGIRAPGGRRDDDPAHSRVRATFQPWWVRLIYDGMIVPSDFIMARSMLRGLARRAEGRPSRGDLDDAGRREIRVHDPVAAEGRTSGPSSERA